MSDDGINMSAFPRPDVIDAMGCGVREGSDGMMLRDYFAAKALAGILSSEVMVKSIASGAFEIGAESSYPYFASAAYELADAMLAARQESAS